PRYFWPAVVILLAIMGTVQIKSARMETQTWDEGLHLANGYSYLRTGDYRLGAEQPPLGKILNAFPLLLIKPHLPIEDPSWKNADEVEFGSKFLYKNHVPADTILMYARRVTIGLTILLGFAVAIWTKRHFGPGQA